MKRILSTILLLTVLLAAKSQVKPVRVTTSLFAPYSTKLDDYTSAFNDKIKVMLFLSDFAQSDYKIKLRLRIEGNGITIETKENYLPQPIRLDGGVSETISGYDLRDYFLPQNLNVKGISRSELFRNGRLPEGFYQIGFEAYDYYRKDVKVSDYIPANVWLMQNDPPELLKPDNNGTVEFNGFQNIIFNWMPQHLGSPNAGNITEYTIEIFEKRIKSYSPTTIVNSTRPVFSETVTATTLIYDESKPQLEPGYDYIWRVKASDSEGLDMFKNNGYSRLSQFTYKLKCDAPIGVDASVQSPNVAEISWASVGDNSSFVLEYKREHDDIWSKFETTDQEYELRSLKADTRYLFRVTPECNTFLGDASETFDFTTQSEKTNTYKCGSDIAQLPEITNKNPLINLYPGDLFYMGDFIIKVDVVSGGNGTFSGEGSMVVPFLNFNRVHVKWDNIPINDEYVAYGGEVRAVRDLKKGSWTSPAKEAELAKAAAEEAAEVAAVTTDTTITINSTVEEVYVTEEGNVMVQTTDGGEAQQVATTSEGGVTIKDNDGKVYVVKDDKVTEYTEQEYQEIINKSTGGTPPFVSDSENDDKNRTRKDSLTPSILPDIEFVAFEGQNYGFDKFKYEAIKNKYKVETINDKQQILSYKSVDRSGWDKVNVEIKLTDTIASYKNVRFYDENGNTLPYQASDKENIKTIQFQGNIEEIEAYYEYTDTAKKDHKHLLNKLVIDGYDKKVVKVTLVSVNGASLPINPQKTLNKIFGQAVAEIEVSQVRDFVIDEFKTTAFKNTGVSMFKDYNSDMKLVYKRFKKKYTYDKDSYYLFFINNPEDRTVQGFMPFKEHFGFIFETTPNNRTVAHELGHGAFRLEHPKEEYKITDARDNLMHYSQTGQREKLIQPQWNFLHNPPFRLYMFKGEEDQQSISLNNLKAEILSAGINLTEIESDKNIAFITPSRKIITLKSNCKAVNFVSNKNYVPNGCLTGFITSTGKKYVALYNPTTKEFLGYASKVRPEEEKVADRYKNEGESTISYYKDELTKNRGKKIKVLIGYKRPCEIELHTVNLDNNISDIHTGKGVIDNNLPLNYNSSEVIGRIYDPQACEEVIKERLVAESFTPTGIDIDKVDYESMKPKIDDAVEHFSKMLEEAVLKSKKPKYDEHLHINGHNLIEFYNENHTKENYTVLENKLQYLKETTGKSIYVLYSSVPFMFNPRGSNQNEFAKNVLEKANIENKDEIIVITIPYVYCNKYISRTSKRDAQQYVMPGFYDNGGIVDTEKLLSYENKTSFDFIYNIYKATLKPFELYTVAINVDGSISKYKSVSKNNISGNNCIVATKYLVNEGFNLLRNLDIDFKECGDPKKIRSIEAANKFINCFNIANYKYQKKRQSIICSHIDDDLKKYNEIKHIKHPLKEKYIADYIEIHARDIVFEKVSFIKWCETVKILWVDNNPNVDKLNLDDVCYNYSWLTVADPLIYTVIDIAGVFAGPFDTAVDALGLAWASYRGDTEQICNYTIALSLPMVGALTAKVIVKGVKAGSKFIYKGAVWVVEQGGKTAKVLGDEFLAQTDALGKIFGFSNYKNIDPVFANTLSKYVDDGCDFNVLNNSKKFASDAERVTYLKQITGQANKELIDILDSKFSKFVENGSISQDLANKISREIRDNYSSLANKIDDNLAELLVKSGNGHVQILSQISGWGDDVLVQLSKDLSANNRKLAKEIFEKIEKNPILIEAWEYTQLINKGTAFARDIEVLKAIQKVLNDQDALKAFSHPKIGGFENFIKKYGDLRCDACGGKGVPNMPTLDEVIENTSYCLKEFADKMDSKIFGQELLTTNRNGRDGIQHMFKHMKANKYKNADIHAIGAKFDKSSQYYDVKFVDGRNLKFIEYKSWLPNNFGTQEHINQFIAYLREIESLDELNYVFNVSKADISVWKSKFKTIFKNNAKDIWNCNEGVFKKIIKIDESGNLEDWEDLYDFFNDKSLTNNNSIFNFIKAN